MLIFVIPDAINSHQISMVKIICYLTRGGIFLNLGIYCLGQKNQSNDTQALTWNSFIQTSNVVSLRLGPYLKGDKMNQKAKQHKQSLAV